MTQLIPEYQVHEPHRSGLLALATWLHEGEMTPTGEVGKMIRARSEFFGIEDDRYALEDV